MRAFKCSVLFFAAAMLFSVGHDFARAIAAQAIGIPITLHNFFMLFEEQPEDALDVVSIHLAPVIFSVVIGVGSLWTYGQTRSPTLRLFLLYLATFGGMKAAFAFLDVAFAGSLHDVATTLGLPAVVQLAVSGASIAGLVVVMWQAGIRLQPPVNALVVPLVVSTVGRLMAYSPMPEQMVLTMLIGSSPWLIAIVASLYEWGRAGRIARTQLPQLKLAWSAVVLGGLLVWVVRVMATGVRLGA